jgi:calcium/calmodulin-dependent protein kinase I
VLRGFPKKELSCDQVAIKCIDYKKLQKDPDGEADLMREKAILMEIDHVNIIKCFDFYVDGTNKMYWMVLEIVNGGELFDRIQDKTTYNENEARSTILLLLDSLAYLHDNRIAHRDLKPENLLLKDKVDDTQLKIADFGFAVKCNGNDQDQMCGTPGYVAPEILAQTHKYGVGVDIWAAGVILFILLGGYPPFYADSDDDMFSMIMKGQFEFNVSRTFLPFCHFCLVLYHCNF